MEILLVLVFTLYINTLSIYIQWKSGFTFLDDLHVTIGWFSLPQLFNSKILEAYLEPNRRSVIKLLLWKWENSNPLSIFVNSSMIYAHLGFKYASDYGLNHDY